MTTISDDSLIGMINDCKKLIIKFEAKWCSKCKPLVPILSEIADDYEGEFEVAVIDIDDNPEAVEKLGITTIPTIVLIKDREIIKKIIGVISKRKLLTEIEEFIKI